MKTIKQLVLVALIAITAFSCKNEAQPEVKTVDAAVEALAKNLDPNATYAKAEFTVEGMTCAVGCAATIQKKIAKMPGVKSAKVDYGKKLAMVEYDEAKVTPASLEKTVTSVAAMYKVTDMKTVDAFSAKSCKADCKKDCCKKGKSCAKDCKKDCCKNKKSCAKDCKKDCCKSKKSCKKSKSCKKDCKKGCKKSCGSKEEKTACAKDCKKACCAKEAKA